MTRLRLLTMTAAIAWLGGCASGADYVRPELASPAGWANVAGSELQPTRFDPDGWWTRLNDPAIDRLVAAALLSNPTLAEAAARVDQERASVTVERARRLPRVDLGAGLSAARIGADSGSGTGSQVSASVSPSASWELDLWGRVREAGLAARSRLGARDADAQDARLSIVAQIAGTALDLRGCTYSLSIRDSDIASRELELGITRKRLAFGNIAPFEVASAESNLASARTDRISQQEDCLTQIDALVALTGLDAAQVRSLNPAVPPVAQDLAALMPAPPPLAPALPAIVLLGSPSVVAAEREVAARWSEIAVARAERRPRIDLSAILTGQFLRAFGSSIANVTGSIGPGLSLPLFDGGAGRANVRFADARYREAVATLGVTLRTVARDIEDGLAAQQSAIERVGTSREAVAAAARTLRANEARKRAGVVTQFELEESRRQFNRAQESVVAASRDRAQAWVELVRRTGSAVDTFGTVGTAATGTAAADAAIRNFPK